MKAVREVKEVTRDTAHRIAKTAMESAIEEGIAIAVVCVDRGGHIVLVDRMDGSATCAVPLAQSKAETAAGTLAPTAMWFESTQPGHPDWGMNIPLGGRFNAMPGGIPIEIDGEIVGAVGVSGGEAKQDVRCAKAGLSAIG